VTVNNIVYGLKGCGGVVSNLFTKNNIITACNGGWSGTNWPTLD